MNFHTISAVLRGQWLIEQQWVQTHLPLVLNMLKGQAVNFGMEKPDATFAKKMNTSSGSAYGVSMSTDLSNIPAGSIAVITIAGPLTKFGDMCSWGMIDYTDLVNRVATNQNVKGIILNIDSPGGTVSGTAMLADSFRVAKQQKPVITHINSGIAASAGYWIASAADEIYVSQGTDQVGSVGVYTTLVDWNAHYLDYYKLPVKDIYAPGSEDKNKDYRDALEGNEKLLKSELKVLRDQFVNTVKRNRGARLTNDDWTSGKMFFPGEARKIGLIDGVKTFEQVVKRMNELIGN